MEAPTRWRLSFVLSRNINKRFRELSKIRGVPVFVGGRSIVNHQGLARRHGLIPLIGSLRASTSQLIGRSRRGPAVARPCSNPARAVTRARGKATRPSPGRVASCPLGRERTGRGRSPPGSGSADQ